MYQYQNTMIAPIAVSVKFFSRFHNIQWNHKVIINKKHAVVRFFKRNFSKSLAVSLLIINVNHIRKTNPPNIVKMSIYQFMRLIHHSSMSFVFWTRLKFTIKCTIAKVAINHKIIFPRCLCKKFLLFSIKKHPQ